MQQQSVQAQAPGAPVGNKMATQVSSASPTPPATGATGATGATAHEQQQQQQQQQPPSTAMQIQTDSYFLTRLKNQVEFYFSPQNLARDTYLRSLMAQYGGSMSMVPLTVIASFPKVRNLCATAIPPDPIFLMIKALEGSNVAKISPDAYNTYWISPLMPPPPLDPSSIPRHMNSMVKPLPHLRQQSSGSVGRTSSPLSNTSYGDNKHSRTTVIVTDIPTDIATEVVMSAFTTDKVMPKSANPVDSNSWHVTFISEQDASNAIATATASGKTINGHPIRAKVVNVNDQQQQPGKSSNKTSQSGASTGSTPQEGSGEIDASNSSVKPQNSNRHNNNIPTTGPVPQIPIQQTNYPSHMTPPPPQGMSNNTGAPGYPYPYPYQPHFQYHGGGSRYHPPHQAHLQPPPTGPHGMQYHPQMFGYQYMQPRPFYGGPAPGPGANKPVFMRSVTDPGQLRPSQMMKGKNNNSTNNNDKNVHLRKSIRKNKGQQYSQFQGYSDTFGGSEQLNQHSNKGSRDSLSSDGTNDYNARKGLGRNTYRDGYGQSGTSRRKSSPMIDTGDNNFDHRTNVKGKKKKSKRRDHNEADELRSQEKTEIFDENMFPALSPSKSTGATSEVAANVANNSFSGYADALRQKNRQTLNVAIATNNSLDNELDFEDSINEMVGTIHISQSADRGNLKNYSIEEESDEAKLEMTMTGTESSSKHMMDTLDITSSNDESNTSNEVTPILETNKQIPKEVGEINSKASNYVNTVTNTSTNEPEPATSGSKNESKNENVGKEAELDSATTGAWSTKRSFIDVVKQS